MSFYILPTKIVIGDLLQLFKEIEALPVEHILVLTSPSVNNISKVRQFADKASAKYQVTVYSTIQPDAPIGDLDRLIADTSKPDLIIGIGGGSVIDSSKSIALGWQGITINDLFYKKQNIPTSKIPVFAVPTTAGTGAELSYGAILYDTADKVKNGIRGEIVQPDLAFLDIDLYTYAPAKLIAEVGFDCLTHAIETYISTASSELVRFQSIAAIKAVFKYLSAAVAKDRAGLEKMAIAAAMMGMNLALSSTCLPHRIQYAIGPLTNTSHAQGLIMLYKGWLPEIAKTDSFKLLLNELDLSEEGFFTIIRKLKNDLNINYSLSQYGISESHLEEIASKVTGNLANDPSYKSNDTIISVLKNSL